MHQAKGMVSAEERAVQVDVDDGGPLFDGEFVEGDGGSGDAGIVKENVEAAGGLADSFEEGLDGAGVRNISRDRGQAAGIAFVGGLLELRFTAASEKDVIAVTAEGEGNFPADAAASSGDQRDAGFRVHFVFYGTRWAKRMMRMLGL